MKLAVAILTWNRAEQLARALESVLAQTRVPDQIVVVDSNSSDHTQRLLRERFPQVKAIVLHRNLGCPEGRNYAMANCEADIIYSLDDDGVLHPRALEETLQVFAAHPNAGIVASKIITRLDPPLELVARQLAKEPRRTSFFSGGASALRRRVLETAGYYPSDFWRQSEEADLALRTIAAGFELWYAPSSILLHPPGITDSGATLDHTTCNTLKSIVRLVPARYVPFVLAHQTLKYLVLGIQRKKFLLVLKGLARWLVALPQLVGERRPVSVGAMREYLALRRAYWAQAHTRGDIQRLPPTVQASES